MFCCVHATGVGRVNACICAAHLPLVSCPALATSHSSNPLQQPALANLLGVCMAATSESATMHGLPVCDTGRLYVDQVTKRAKPAGLPVLSMSQLAVAAALLLAGAKLVSQLCSALHWMCVGLPWQQNKVRCIGVFAASTKHAMHTTVSLLNINPTTQHNLACRLPC